MFDIGFAELLVVGIVGLLVLGPEKLPTAARALGLWLGRIKRSLGSIQAEISHELRMEELKRTSAVSKEKLNEELKEMSQPFSQPFGSNSPLTQTVQPPPVADSNDTKPASTESGQDGTDKKTV